MGPEPRSYHALRRLAKDDLDPASLVQLLHLLIDSAFHAIRVRAIRLLWEEFLLNSNCGTLHIDYFLGVYLWSACNQLLLCRTILS